MVSPGLTNESLLRPMFLLTILSPVDMTYQYQEGKQQQKILTTIGSHNKHNWKQEEKQHRQILIVKKCHRK